MPIRARHASEGKTAFPSLARRGLERKDPRRNKLPKTIDGTLDFQGFQEGNPVTYFRAGPKFAILARRASEGIAASRCASLACASG
jgi:hypothetical protein